MSGRATNYSQLAFDTIDELERLATSDAVLHKMSNVLSAFGYTSFLIASASSVRATTETPIALVNGWPAGWYEEYWQKNYLRDDPIAQKALTGADPFEWSEVHFDPKQSPRAAHVMRVAQDFGLVEGYVVPIIRSDTMDAVTMAGRWCDFDRQAKRAIHLIALYAHSKALQLAGRGCAPLSRRILTPAEREALRWVAMGKSSWEISVILDISEAAVIARIQHAARKLDAVNRTHAVVLAVRAKEIEL